MINEMCENCRFCWKPPNVGGFFCRRYPPQPLGPDRVLWPAMMPNEWCGEWEWEGEAEISA